MADEFSLSIDTDWKKQAQEEKRKLVEEQQKKAAASASAAVVTAGAKGDAAGRPGSPARGRQDSPTASFGTLVQTLMSQALFYMGELSPGGGEGNINLDRAKYQVDTLGLLEEKTANNLLPDEQHLLDSALYEVRMRFVNVASQYL